jgi:ADP-heptose:LPS heptosyltransferase
MTRALTGLQAVAELFKLKLKWIVGGNRRATDQPKNILVLGYMGVGDLVLFTPALRALKQAFPQSRITWLTGSYSGAAALTPAVPEIDEVLTFDWAGMDQMEKRIVNRALRERHFDLVIANYFSPVRFFMSGLSNVPLRVGSYRVLKFPHVWRRPFAYLRWRMHFEFLEEEFFRKRFFNVRVPITSADVHEVDKALKLIRAIATGNHDRTPRLNIPSVMESRAKRTLDSLGVKSGDHLIAVHPAASPGQRWKQWPLERYATLCQHLIEREDVKILAVGTAAEWTEMSAAFKDLPPTRLLSVPDRDLLEVAAMLRRCALVVGGDSGIAHLAVALGVPTVRLFGPTDPRAFAPINPGPHVNVTVDIVCRPCVFSGLPAPGVLNFTNCGHRACLNQMDETIVYNQVVSAFRATQHA